MLIVTAALRNNGFPGACIVEVASCDEVRFKKQAVYCLSCRKEGIINEHS